MELSYSAVCFDLFGTLVEPDGRAVAGAREALRVLPADRWAIVTSCGTAYARALLAQAGLPLPEILVASDTVPRNKPAPDPYLAGARHLGIDAAEILVVEDSVDGIAAGRAAGMDVLAILRGRRLEVARAASFQVDRFNEIDWLPTKNGSIRLRIEP